MTHDDACDRLNDAVDSMDDSDDDLEEAVDNLCPPDVTFQSYTTKKTHSYRNHSPAGVAEIMLNPELDGDEQRSQAQSAIRFIEAGRLDDLLKAVSEFFFKLDNDEQMLFTRRNPDVVEWMTVWQEAREAMDPLKSVRTRAGEWLTEDRGRAVNPPKFDRTNPGHGLFKDMRHRRRSYRNWTPFEFVDILSGGPYEVNRLVARELEFLTPKQRGEIDFPIELDGETAARRLLCRVEDGRFAPVLDALTTFVFPLDNDERELFAARNPGLTQWLDAWGRANHTTQGRDLRTVEFPVLREE